MRKLNFFQRKKSFNYFFSSKEKKKINLEEKFRGPKNRKKKNGKNRKSKKCPCSILFRRIELFNI